MTALKSMEVTFSSRFLVGRPVFERTLPRPGLQLKLRPWLLAVAACGVLIAFAGISKAQDAEQPLAEDVTESSVAGDAFTDDSFASESTPLLADGRPASRDTLAAAARSLTESPLSADEMEYLRANVLTPEGEWAANSGIDHQPSLQPYETEQEPWRLQLMPKGLIYRSYMAGVKESGFRSVWNHDENLGWIWDISLGGRAGILRWGTPGGYFPQGYQLDIEGASLLRLDPEDQRDLVAADFRFGIPLTYGRGRWQTKIAYYHLSSHLGDEYMLKHPLEPRVNYAGDSMVFGLSFYPKEYLRLYGETAYAFFRDIKEPWEFQFGFDLTPYWSRGLRGAPFVAMNGLIRQEVDYSGHWVVQAGWQWRGQPGSGIFRMGVQYFSGKSELFEFFDRDENKVGIGLWYDF